jgi:8-oxo-dGTP pyrophosphatase MutT (NUDIX family)
MNYPQKVYRAAMVCYHLDENSNIEMLFIIPSDIEFGGDQPQLCKGKVEEGEDDLQAAIREAKEEVGLFENNVVGQIVEVGMFLGRTTVFVCKIKDKAMFGLPDFEVESTHWMTLEQFLEQGRQLHHAVIRDVHDFIRRLEKL